jgi:hypothetical protein
MVIKMQASEMLEKVIRYNHRSKLANNSGGGGVLESSQ